MQLFKVQAGKRVRLTSKLIRWVEHGSERKIAENTTWEATTTSKFYYYKGAQRRLMINHTIDWPEYGIWQRDCEVEVIPDAPENTTTDRYRQGILVTD